MQVAQLNPFLERTSSGKLRLPKAALMSTLAIRDKYAILTECFSGFNCFPPSIGG
jgi:hypothetical protein